MLINRLHLPIIAILFSIALSGCVSLKQAPLNQQQTDYKKTAPLTRQQRLMALKNWRIQGAVSVKQPKQSFIASYQWRQSHGRYHISIHSNLDLASVTLNGNRSQVKLTSSDGTVAQSTSLTRLMQQQLGWQLPVNNLIYWIRSLAAPGQAQSQYNALGQTQQIQQGKWTVRYSRYERIDNLELPTLLNITGPQINLRIVVKNWQL